MKNFAKTTALLMTSLLVLTACQAGSPPLTGPEMKIALQAPPAAQKLVGEVSQSKFDPRVDILFVIDDSASMTKHQENLSRNINKFIDKFAEFKSIDFHIGYTTVHDRTRYGTVVPQRCGENTSTPGRVNWEDPGVLRPMLGTDKRFLTKQDDFATILRATLDPQKNKELIKKHINPDAANPSLCPYGPEEEESFTPLLGALNNPIVLNGANKGFRRAGAMFIAVLLSDAKDSSGMTAEDVAGKVAAALAAEGAKPRFRIFAVAMKPGDRIGAGTESWNRGCKPDPAFASGKTQAGSYSYRARQVGADENPLANLARLTEDGQAGSQVLSICDSNYGGKLAEFGEQVKRDVLADVEVRLSAPPLILDEATTRAEDARFRECLAQKRSDCEPRTLQVLVGNTALVRGTQWVYNVQRQSVIVFSDKVDWAKLGANEVRVNFTPVTESNKYRRPLN
jgi:hypothetical protein